MGKATREAPAQAELRPTSAGAFRVILLCGVTPLNSAVDWSTNFIRGDVAGQGHAGSPGSDRASPYLACDFRKTKNCMRTNATKVAGGTAKSLAINMWCVIVERQRWTMTTVVNQLDRTTVRYCINWRT
jgi:hypothetical protein